MRRSWRATRYLLTGGATAVAAAVVLGALAGALALSLVVVGVVLLPPAVRALGSLARLEYRRAGRFLGTPVTVEPRPLTDSRATRLRAAASGSPPIACTASQAVLR